MFPTVDALNNHNSQQHWEGWPDTQQQNLENNAYKALGTAVEEGGQSMFKGDNLNCLDAGRGD